jgi:purine nucleoside phosphorylase
MTVAGMRYDSSASLRALSFNQEDSDRYAGRMQHGAEIGFIAEAGYKTGWRSVLPDYERVTYRTAAGDVTGFAGRIEDRSVVVIPRWGLDERMPPPHRLPFAATALAFHETGVQRIVSENGSGCLAPAMAPSDIVIPDDFIEFAATRPLTLFDDPAHENYGARIDMSRPFCAELRSALVAAALGRTRLVYDRGVFGNLQGPRSETPAEIRVLRQLGVDIVGTPIVTEAVFARELGMCYAVIAPVQNYAPGIHRPADVDAAPGVHREGDVGAAIAWLEEDAMTKLHRLTTQIVRDAIRLIPADRTCGCGDAVAGFRERVRQFRVFRE